MPRRHHILILAAGRGTRMGGPKALMDINGRPWWRHQQDRLPQDGFAATWVVSPEVQAAMSSIADPPNLVVADPMSPMFVSILAGLDALRTAPPESVFILPVDCPAASQDVWRSLADTSTVTMPAYKGKRGHPVHLPWAFITETLDPAVTRAPDPAALRLDELITPVAHVIPVDDPAVAINLNTPDDVRMWLDRRTP